MFYTNELALILAVIQEFNVPNSNVNDTLQTADIFLKWLRDQ